MKLARNKSARRPARGTWIVINLLGISAAASAQPSPYASDLQNPTKVILGPAGTLLVSETGDTPNSGRISLIQPGGSRSTLLSNLPSGLSAPTNQPDGPTDMVLRGRTLYVEIGEGDTLVAGPRPQTEVANPVGPSSPILVSILKFTFSNNIETFTTFGFRLALPDHFSLLDGGTVLLNNGAGGTATVELVTQFRPSTPDPKSIYRNSHPYGMTMLDSEPDTLYIADAGQNDLIRVDVTSGRTKVVTRFADTPSPLPVGSGPLLIEAVPTSVRPYQDTLLVSLFTGDPFVPGLSRIMSVSPQTGEVNWFIAWLSSATDVLYRKKADGSLQFFTLEYSLELTTGKPGRLMVFDTPVGKTLWDSLVTPSSMVLDEATGILYITNKTAGTIVQFDVGK